MTICCSNCPWKQCFFTLPPGLKAKITGRVGQGRKVTVTKEAVSVAVTPYFAVFKYKAGYKEAFLFVDCKTGTTRIKPAM